MYQNFFGNKMFGIWSAIQHPFIKKKHNLIWNIKWIQQLMYKKAVSLTGWSPQTKLLWRHFHCQYWHHAGRKRLKGLWFWAKHMYLKFKSWGELDCNKYLGKLTHKFTWITINKKTQLFVQTQSNIRNNQFHRRAAENSGQDVLGKRQALISYVLRGRCETYNYTGQENEK